MAWVLTTECDSLLFSCLDAVGRDEQFDIARARLRSGMWLRRPAGCGSCSSTTSRDMQMGLLVYCLHFKRLDILDALWSYGWKHNWRMGIETKPAEEVEVPVLSKLLGWYPRIRTNRVYYTPGLIVLLGAIRAHLRGQQALKGLLLRVPQPMSTAPGYTSHLSLLHIYLNRRMRGSLSQAEQSSLMRIQRHMEGNPLVAALQGNGPKALALLEKHWPGGVPAPKTAWSEPWRLQRSDGDSGLEPDPAADPLVYHGDGDYQFARHATGLFC